MEKSNSSLGRAYRDALDNHRMLFASMDSLEARLVALAKSVVKALEVGGKLIFFGNGGSAADAQHLAAELVNRFVFDRRALAGLALTTDTSSLTAIANDSSYDHVFARQLEALGRPGDVALGISTSGNSSNVIQGIRRASDMGMITAAFTGQGGGALGELVDHLIAIPSSDTGRIQEGHIFVGHLLCEMIERSMVDGAPAPFSEDRDAPKRSGGKRSSRTGAFSPAESKDASDKSPIRRVISADEGDEGVFVHESSYVDEGVVLGRRTKVWHFSHIQSGARLGEGCVVGQNVNIGPRVVIGSGVKIQNNVSVYQGVIVEDDVFLGPSMVFTNVVNPRSHVNRKAEFKETKVGRGATIGANATIVCGHSIGRFAFVGAGAVVTHSVPDHALVLGNPARIAGWMCRCGTRLDLPADLCEGLRARCPACRSSYAVRDGKRIEAV